MALIPYYKTTIESKLTPKEVCQKLALFVEQKNMDEIKMRELLGPAIDMLLYNDKKRFIGVFDESHIILRPAFNNFGDFNICYFKGVIRESREGKAIIDIQINSSKTLFYILVFIAIFGLFLSFSVLYSVSILFNESFSWIPVIAVIIVSLILYLFYRFSFNASLSLYNESLIPHLKSLSIQELIKRRNERKQRRKSRRR